MSAERKRRMSKVRRTVLSKKVTLFDWLNELRNQGYHFFMGNPSDPDTFREIEIEFTDELEGNVNFVEVVEEQPPTQ